jgi:hypothetical protein
MSATKKTKNVPYLFLITENPQTYFAPSSTLASIIALSRYATENIL